jgi:hypothetical protein
MLINLTWRQHSLLPLLLLFVAALISSAAPIAAQTGGTYDLSHNVIAGGGGSQSTGGTYSVDGTAGQNLAGTVSICCGYGSRGGFWAFESLVPTAASASIGGRIRTIGGLGIGNVRLVLTNAATGESFQTISSPFGYYIFENVLVGKVYVLTVSSKRFSFDPNMRTISLLDEITNEDFTALQLK